MLNQLVGPAKAKELFFTGRRVQADEALALGIYNQVVEDDAFPDAVFLATNNQKLATSN